MVDASSIDNDCVTIKVSGDFSFSLNKALQQALQQYQMGERSFVIDLSDAHTLDSSSLGMLLQLRAHSRDDERVQLLNPQAGVKQQLLEADFCDLFTLVES